MSEQYIPAILVNPLDENCQAEPFAHLHHKEYGTYFEFYVLS